MMSAITGSVVFFDSCWNLPTREFSAFLLYASASSITSCSVSMLPLDNFLAMILSSCSVACAIGNDSSIINSFSKDDHSRVSAHLRNSSGIRKLTHALYFPCSSFAAAFTSSITFFVPSIICSALNEKNHFALSNICSIFLSNRENLAHLFITI